MSIADIILSSIIWIFQKTILPLLPTNLPFFSFDTFHTILTGNLKNNLIHSLNALGILFNVELLFILIGVIIFAEVLLFLIRSGLLIIRLVRG